MLYLAGFLVGISIILIILAGKQRKKSGIPRGQVIYSDSKLWGKVEKPLYDAKLHLTGKPDYLLRKGNQFIPVEVKSGRASHEPKEWHIYQLAAYCLLVENEYNVRPFQGIIHYQNKTFAVDFTNTLEESTKEIIHTMQTRASQIQVDRSHNEQERCLHCGYRSVCNQALRI